MSMPTFGVWYDFRQIQPAPMPYAQFYREVLDEIVEAEQLGFSHVWLSEHHLVDDGYLPSQLVAAAAIAGRTSKIQIGTNVLLLPLYHPVRVAEDVAVLDLVSGGRIILGVGGGYVQFEFEAFGVERKFRPSLLEEGVAFLRQAWDTGRAGFHGKRWRFADLPFSPQPERKIPIYFGANAPAAIERAARLGDGFLSTAPKGFEQVRSQHAALHAALPPGKSMPFIVSAWLHLGDSREQALAEVAEGIAYQQSRYADWGTDREQPRPPKVTAAEVQGWDMPLFGTPEQVAEQLVNLHRDVAYEHLCFWTRLPGLSHAQTRRNMERFQAEVVPLVEKALR